MVNALMITILFLFILIPQNCGWESKFQPHLLSGVVIYHNSIISKLGFLAISHQPHQVGFVQHLSQS